MKKRKLTAICVKLYFTSCAQISSFCKKLNGRYEKGLVLKNKKGSAVLAGKVSSGK